MDSAFISPNFKQEVLPLRLFNPAIIGRKGVVGAISGIGKDISLQMAVPVPMEATIPKSLLSVIKVREPYTERLI